MPYETDDKTVKAQNKEDKKTITNVALVGAAAEGIQRFGAAIKEFFVGYSGVDNETGQVLKKSLKNISESKINPDYEHNNIHQQAGNSAEVAKVAKDNAENIINESNKRTVRTDDHPDYKTNDTVVDHVEVINGSVIPGSGSQMKFVNDPKELIDKIATGEGGGKSDLSRYLDTKLDLPTDQVNDKAYQKYCSAEAKRLRQLAEEKSKDGKTQEAQRLQKKANRIEDGKNIGLKEYCDQKAKELREDADLLERMGKSELAEKKRQQAKNYEKVKNNIRDRGISTKKAIFYRKHPKIATALDIAGISHRAGLEQAKSGAVIGGSISIIRNLVAVIKGEKEAEDALYEVAIDTGSAAALSYSIAFTGSALKGAMQNAKSEMTRTLSKTNLAAMLVIVTLETGKTLTKYIKGEIDGVQCLEELGEKVTGMISSALFSSLGVYGAVSVFGKSFVIGQIAIPIPVIGGLIGGMLGYTLSSACYGQLMSALKDAKIAREQRIQIEAECAEAIRMIREYRAEIEIAISEYLSDHIITFHTAFDKIEAALKNGDTDSIIAQANIITEKLHGKPQFKNISEFEILMKSSESLSI